jgi:transposase
MAKHPEWALKFKTKGTELRLINGRYYLYKITSKWDPVKKRSKKVTLALLGRITKEEGFIESEKHKLKKQLEIEDKISIKEFGISSFINTNLSNYIDLIKKHFPEQYKFIIALSYCRFAYQSSLKNAEYHFSKSYLSEIYKRAGLSSKSISKKLKEIGMNRDNILNFFKEFEIEDDNLIFDGTDMLSNSEKMDYPQKSKTKKGNFDKLLNLMFIFSSKTHIPLYYRLLRGKIKDMSAFKLCLDEAGITDALIIADKGFYSLSNVEKLDKEDLNYIIPLKRNSSLIDYAPLKSGNLKEFDGYFMYNNKAIWYYEKNINNRRVIVYKDDYLKTEELNDYLRRCETLPELYNMDKFYENQHSFGTLAFITNLSNNKSAQEIYSHYKSRNEIEKMINVFKNILESDKSYMQNEEALEGWMFINFIAMHWYYRMIQLLLEKNLNSKYSVKDIITFLRGVKKIKIRDKWYNAEITKKDKALLETLELTIT